jgi:hypothetical protein
MHTYIHTEAGSPAIEALKRHSIVDDERFFVLQVDEDRDMAQLK